MKVPNVEVPVFIEEGKTQVYTDEKVDIFVTASEKEFGLELYISHSDAPKISPHVQNAYCDFCDVSTEKNTVMCLDEKYARLFSKTMLRLQSTYNLKRVNYESVIGECIFCDGSRDSQLCFSESFVPWD